MHGVALNSHLVVLAVIVVMILIIPLTGDGEKNYASEAMVR